MPSFEEKYRKRAMEGQAAEAPLPSPGPSPAMELLKAAATDEYKAYNTVTHPEFELWVRPNDANAFAQVSIPYSRRNHMITDGAGFFIGMHFDTPVLCVTLHGRNLNDLHRKLLRHEVEWVMEYDARKWPALPDDAPCITGIEVTQKSRPGKDAALPGETKAEPDKPATH